ncbi:DUF4342 domain-containing protein [Metallumcola ferriviriculae]|uniref:DUF4342 domain-containing protein n=1 Tax=Metallumcola ferriviriculae TaxID=3039180 RepID=A0AAU0UN58_9FIRM|nr:DUF4342 domain-containing protein [Desulfitibacteraceae bacterium MK1]
MDELAKIDQIRQRLDVSYKEAKEALDQADGDVVKAIIDLEEEKQHFDHQFHEHGSKLMAQIKHIFQKGNVTKVRLKKDNETVLEIPATVGALGVVGALSSAPLAIIAGIGTVTAMTKNYKLEIVRPDGTVEEKPLYPEVDPTEKE